MVPQAEFFAANRNIIYKNIHVLCKNLKHDSVRKIFPIEHEEYWKRESPTGI